MTTPFNTTADPKSVRRKLGLNQQEFWSRIGVTQSGGSRYESGRRMPKPVLELLRVVHVERIDLSRVNREDMELIALLKDKKPEVYAELRDKISAAQPAMTMATPAAVTARAKPASEAARSAAQQDDLEDSDYGFLDAVPAGRSQWSDDHQPVYENVEALLAKRRR